jgi:putative membrane-bound dehydrogenase-like protein
MISRTILALLVSAVSAFSASAAPLKVLFLGDAGAHLPRQRFDQLQPVFAKKQIELVYTNKAEDLLKLDGYDGLIVFANIDTITPAQEKALLAYVESGKGFIPVHCASFCFRNSDAVVKMIGAQFRSHTTGVFRTKSTGVEHPILKDFEPFQSWDETYVHTKHNNEGRTVLEIREDRDLKEPWTWVRTQGKGRVFYTAWGHDHRTWSHPGFHNLLERGTRWACGQDPAIAGPYVDKPKMTDFAADAKPFEYVPAKLPFYPPGERWGTLREPISKMQKPLSPEESIKHYSTPIDFEIKTFVAEDQLGGGKPICMTWDERGRLWLAISYDYPNELKSEGEGRDKIVCCEDVNNDGTCDKITVFADKLSIPTSILPIRGGLVVHMAPNTWFLKDSDGDGKADVKQILMTGWGTNDTHAGPSSLRYGPDNWIYGMCGYSGFNGRVNGENIRFGQGPYRFQVSGGRKSPEELTVTKLEFLRSTNNNSWGVAFNEQGELFGSTANGCPLVHCAIPNRYYEKVKGLTPGPLQNIAYDNHIEPVVKDYRQVDWHGGFTAGAGLAIYTARTYPEEYWNKVAFISEPTAHLTAAMVLQPNGASYTARYGWNLLAGRDDWAAPIDAQVGPDGHMWVIDWYNIIVQHNPTPAGYRTGRGNAYEIDLRDKKYGRVYRVVYKKAKPEPRVDLKDAKTNNLRSIAYTHHNMTWRLHAQRLLYERGEEIQTASDVSKQISLQTELKYLLDLSDKTAKWEHVDGLLKRLTDSRYLTDPNLNHALIIASVSQAEFVLPEIAKLNLPPVSLSAVELIARNAGGIDLSNTIINLENAKSPAVSDAIIRGLSLAGKPAKQLNAQSEKAFGRLLTSLPAASRGRLLKLSSSWGVKGLDAQLAELSKGLYVTMADETASDSNRLDAVRQIVEFQPDSDDAALKIVAAVNGKSSPQFAAGVFEALSASRAKGIGSAVVAKVKELPATARPVAMRVVLARPESAKAFLDSVEKGELRFDVLELDQKAALSTHPDATVRDRAKKLLAMGGGLPDADRQKVIHQFEPILKKTGDVGLGKKMFVQHCAKCHKHGGEGLTIGPDLTGFAVHPKEEILIHVLDPSRSVEGNYKAYTARLADGRVVTGLLASETRTSVELVDAENKRHALNRDDLDELKESSKSLMPEGFEKQMTADDLTNLLEFMAQKGKYVPIPLDKYATSVSTRGMFNEFGAAAERLVFREWKPVEFKGVPFYLVDPQGEKVKNAIVLHSPQGRLTQSMPKSVTLPCNTAAKAIHVLGGIGGWASPYGDRGSVSVIVTLMYDDGQTEKVEWKNGVHIADYIRRVDVPQSEFAFRLRQQQVRYLSIEPKRKAPIKSVTFEKGPDTTAPVFMAVTIETP